MKINSIYVIGSLRNIEVPHFANTIESETGIEAFDGWFSPGPDTDDRWRDHEIMRGRSYGDALKQWHARHVFEFDKHHLDRCDATVLCMPAGKSAHIELGYVLGKGKPGFIVFQEEPERWDVMYQFATGIYFSVDEFLAALRKWNA